MKHEITPLRGLRYRRRVAEISQVEAARRLGWSQPTYSRIERGTTDPTLTQCLAMAKMLGCKIEELL